MPIYEYECEKCRERFSLLRPMRDINAPATCPRCGEQDARRVISQFATTGCGPVG
jgi:putative FmdB family regulatory protein